MKKTKKTETPAPTALVETTLASAPITFEESAHADEHLRFVLNTVEGVLGVLGTTVATACHATHAQPETTRAFNEVVTALNKAYATLRAARVEASVALRNRTLKDAP